ncbi:MAG: ATP-dependent helicase [Acidobacteria bacterium]|nr:ATP-dependent helicase [Acidobacteriota bacterium]
MVELNPEQRQAIEHGGGPMLVIAGPGSGKTRVITERIVHLLSHVPGLRPEQILAVTFTEKAAGEMKHRVTTALPDLESPPHISTFHAFCLGVLRERHFERRLLDKVDVWIFLRQRMEHLGLDFYQKLAEPGAFLHDLNEFFSRCQDELIEPEDFEAYVAQTEGEFLNRAAHLDTEAATLEGQEILKKKELARVFRNSRKLIEDAGCSNLGSLISEAVRFFDCEPETLELQRSKFRYVLVDEFQDSNFAQVELLRRLVVKPYNITAVGDEDQAIYRFRGAAHGAFEMFHRAFPGAAVVNLFRNYRSTQRVLRASGVVIAKNTHSGKKPPLMTEREDGDKVLLLDSLDYPSEAAWAAEEIERLAKRGTRLGDIAVLYRAHSHRDLLVGELRARRIPFSIRGLSVLSTVIVRDVVAYLNLVHSPHHNISLTRVLLAGRWRFPAALALEIRKESARERCSLFTAIETREKAEPGGELSRTGWSELNMSLRNLRSASHELPMTALFDRLVEFCRPPLGFSTADLSNLDAFQRFLGEWEAKSETRRLAGFIPYFQYFQDAGGKVEAPSPRDSTNAVQMMTVHSAKGLEFPVVFILSVAPRRFPHGEQKPVIEFPDELRKGPEPPPDIHLQEERRLFFVAMTRAKDRLLISSVAKQGKKPSEFIDDLLSSPAVTARDMERIQVPQHPAEDLAHRRARTPEPSVHTKAQPSLFGKAEAPPSAVYPNLDELAGPLPASSSDGKLRLSATSIETFQTCPLKYKLGHELHVPAGPQPTLTFGNIMHQSVRHYFDLRKNGKVKYEDIEEFYLKAWRAAGFEDAYQEQTYRKAGLEQLREFVLRHESMAVPADRVRTEEHFLLDMGECLLEGRIDQINPVVARGRTDDSTVELIDYKTGRPKSQKDADKSLQLSIYALAARDGLKLRPEKLTFYNLTSNEPVSTTRTTSDLKQAAEKIREVAGEIRGSNFAPTPGFACKWCDYVPICPAHEEVY